MTVRSFSFVVGVVYTVLGILGLIPGFVETAPSVPEIMTQVGVTQGYGYLLGLFPTNIFGSFVYIVIGAIGIAGYRAPEATARLFVDFFAVWLGLFSLLGLIPVANTLFGLMPIFGNDVWLHLATAVPAAFFGFGQDQGALRSDPAKAEQLKESYYR
ncbi:MAG: DUF4383 domain-containing protein [Phormidesmis sp.]